jgi:hypothetical protein
LKSCLRCWNDGWQGNANVSENPTVGTIFLVLKLLGLKPRRLRHEACDLRLLRRTDSLPARRRGLFEKLMVAYFVNKLSESPGTVLIDLRIAQSV